MISPSVILAVEDPPGKAVALKILEHVGVGLRAVTGSRCKSDLKKQAPLLNHTARSIPVLMLVDQDTPSPCPPELIEQWLKGPRHQKFLLRVVVMEIESWVLAHREAFAKFLKILVNRIPSDTDTIPEPKEFLVNLARKSRKSRLKSDLVPQKGDTRKVGPDYNAVLCEFIRVHWDPEQAANASPSLRRTIVRLCELAGTSSSPKRHG